MQDWLMRDGLQKPSISSSRSLKKELFHQRNQDGRGVRRAEMPLQNGSQSHGCQAARGLESMDRCCPLCLEASSVRGQAHQIRGIEEHDSKWRAQYQYHDKPNRNVVCMHQHNASSPPTLRTVDERFLSPHETLFTSSVPSDSHSTSRKHHVKRRLWQEVELLEEDPVEPAACT